MSMDAETRTTGPAPEAAATEPALKKIGKYQIEKKLGQGGMGTVYLARDMELRRLVAIKVLPEDKAGNPTLVRRFKAEAQAAAQLRHDNIVAVYDSDEADGHLFIAMEYVEGHDLHEMIARRGKIPVKRSIEIIKQVVSALQHAHEHKIVHRDIKPSNLLIRRDGAVKLTDLGLARSVDDTIETGITRAGTTVGTVDYMAPEQARSSKSADIRSDIYSLGCTWFQMLTGRPPYPEGSLTNKLQAHAVKSIPDPRGENSNVTEGLVAVIQRMMAKKPEDRYQTPAELLKDLENSSLTRAAFSQEIFNAIGDESGHAVAAHAVAVEDADPVPSTSGRTRGKGRSKSVDEVDEPVGGSVAEAGGSSNSGKSRKPSGALPPPSRRRPVEEDTERPPSQLAEQLKMIGLIAGVIGGIGALAWLASHVGNLFDSSSNMVFVAPGNPNGAEVVPEAGQPIVAAVSGGATGPGANTGVSVAPVFSSGATAPPNSSGSAGFSAGVNANAGQRTNSGSGVGPGSVNSGVSGTGNAAISSAALSGIRPADPFQRPDWSKSAAPPPPTNAVGFSVGSGTRSGSHVVSLNDALLKLPPEGGVVRLVGSGPFSLSLTVPLKFQRLIIMGDPKVFSLVVPVKSTNGELGRLDVTGDLELSDVHIAHNLNAQPPAAPTALVRVQEGSLTLLNSSISVLGDGGAGVSAIQMNGGKVPQRLVCRRTALRGNFTAAIDLRTSAIDAIIDESLIVGADGAALRFEGRSGLTPSDVTSRWVRCFASTLCCPVRLVDFAPEARLSEQPKTELVFRDVIGCTGPISEHSTLLSVVDWNQQPVRDQITWTASDSTFLGFQHLVDFGAKSSFRADDADGWRQFWRQKVSAQEFVSASWPVELGSPGTASPLSFDRNLLPAEARQAGSRGELPGVSAGWLRLPDAVHPGRLAALAGRPNPPVLTNWSTNPPVQIDVRKQDLGQILAKNDWPDGTVIDAVGYGVCQMTPVVITSKRLKVRFYQADGGPMRLVPKDAARSVEALFDVRNGALELEGLRADVMDVRPRHPHWLISAADSRIILNACDLRGPGSVQEPYQGLIRMTASHSDADSPPFVSVTDSVILGPGTLMKCRGGGGRLFAQNCLLVTNDRAIDVELAARDGGVFPFSLDLKACTMTASNSIFQVAAAELKQPASSPARWFVDDCAFVPPAPWKLSAGTRPTLVRCAGPVLDQRQVAWWGRSNGIAKEFQSWITVANGSKEVTLSTPQEWEAAWGAGHDLNLLTGADGVVLAASYPARPDQLSPAQFALFPSSKGSVWADGQPIGADLGILAAVGPVPTENESDASKKGGTKTLPPRSNPSTKPGF